MGNVLGTNYREPTGWDWAAFCGLTFDCWVNARMKTFNLLPEKHPNIKRANPQPRKQLVHGYVYHTFYCLVLRGPVYMCVCVCVRVCVRLAELESHILYTNRLSCGDVFDCIKKMFQS